MGVVLPGILVVGDNALVNKKVSKIPWTNTFSVEANYLPSGTESFTHRSAGDPWTILMIFESIGYLKAVLMSVAVAYFSST